MNVRRVALLIDTSRGYGRGVLRGVWRYIQEHQHWSFVFRPASFEEPIPEWLATWDGDGVLLFLRDEPTAQLLRETGVRAIDLLGDFTTEFPFVGADHRRIAEMAADHLLDRGLTHFAACGPRPGSRSGLDLRIEAFRERIEASGHHCKVFQYEGCEPASWESEQEQRLRWIAELSRPVGVFACNDILGREVLWGCRQAAIDVPDQVAVLGAGNDELLCELSDDRLSSIDVDPQSVGYCAAAVLDRMISGETVPQETLIPPRYVVTRQSTDVLAVKDHAVATALRFIQRHALGPISVSDIVAEVSVERRVLERRFRTLVGRSLKSEITRTRLQRAKELLVETNLSCERIAHLCGFGSPSYFMDLFHRKVGTTAGSFRGARAAASRRDN